MEKLEQLIQDLQDALTNNTNMIQEMLNKLDQVPKTEKQKYTEVQDKIQLIKQNITNLNRDIQEISNTYSNICNHLRTHQIIIGYKTGNTDILQKMIGKNILSITNYLEEAINNNKTQLETQKEFSQSIKNKI